MSVPLMIALRPEVERRTRIGADGEEIEMLEARWGALALPRAGTPERAPVDLLLSGPATPSDCEASVAPTGTTGLARWMFWAARASRRGFLSYRLLTPDGTLVADVVPTSPEAPNLMLGPPAAPCPARLQLSRFAVLHRGARGMILESPCANMRAELTVAAVAVIAAFVVPITPADAADTVLVTPGFGAAQLDTLVAVLLRAGLLAEVGDDDLLAEDRDPALSQWEFHDLLLHDRSRMAHPDEPRGGTYRFAGARPAPAAAGDRERTASGSGTDSRVILSPPDLAAVMAADPPFAQVMEDRSSRRNLSPLTIAQLSEFLYRTMRDRGWRGTVEQADSYPRPSRPYPAAGGLYELTTYLAVADCEGLPAGLYRYDPFEHELILVTPSNPDVDRLLREGGGAATLTTPPPVLVILAADFRRLSWKYEGIAYALTLKNVGVLFATMQLAATAMGLGSCPVGAGDSFLFARTAGTRLYEESSVGEFLLGT
ncbi:MAG: SagB family peptide dehydrogenase [Allobranchiibius sp.]